MQLLPVLIGSLDRDSLEWYFGFGLCFTTLSLKLLYIHNNTIKFELRPDYQRKQRKYIELSWAKMFRILNFISTLSITRCSLGSRFTELPLSVISILELANQTKCRKSRILLLPRPRGTGGSWCENANLPTGSAFVRISEHFWFRVVFVRVWNTNS